MHYHMTEYHLNEMMPELDDDANPHLPVLSAVQMARYYFEDKAPLCISSLGAHLKIHGYDWIGCATPTEVKDTRSPSHMGYPMREASVENTPLSIEVSSDQLAAIQETSSVSSDNMSAFLSQYEPRTLIALLTRGVTLGLCDTIGTPVQTVVPMLIPLT
ncbi:hypothetical protein KIPB_012062, partial [Kipferlia bialata]|eukprot:g12062.t1